MPPPLRTATALALLLAACPDRPRPPPALLAHPLPAAAGSPWVPACNPAVPGATVWPGSQVEPHLAVDPLDAGHLVAVWQQDRWHDGGANGIGSALSRDGGLTWTAAQTAFTHCSGDASPSSHDRASDPWVSFAPDGTVHQVALVFDDPWHDSRQAIAVSRSGDGGVTWSAPLALAEEASSDLALDKCTISADPGRPGHVYAVWDRLAGLAGDPTLLTGAAWLGRSTDGGAHWDAARAIYDPGPDAQTISNQVVVLPDAAGTLLDLLVIIRGMSNAAASTAQVAVLRSPDAGLSWDPPVTVAALGSVGTVDPRNGHPVRDGSVVPQIAVDRASGRTHVVWQDARFSGGRRDGIALSSSDDGGRSWSAPLQVSRAPAVAAFSPAVAVAGSGRLGVSYSDFRALGAGPSAAGLWTVRWLATSADGGLSWDEVAVGGPFDLARAPEAHGWFVGDYAGLVGLADAFLPFFSMAGQPGTEAEAAPPAVQGHASVARAAPGSPSVEALAGSTGSLADRVRAMREGGAGERSPP